MGRIACATPARVIAWVLAAACAGIPCATAAHAGLTTCVGDCADDGAVTANDLVVGVNLVLGRQPLAICRGFDRNGDGTVTVDELIAGVRSALEGCSAAPTSTPTSIATPTPTPTGNPVPGNPTGLTAALDLDVVRLNWTLPDPASGNTLVIVLRRLNAAVAGPQDPLATEIFFGPASTAFDDVNALLPDLAGQPRTYSYAAYGCSGPSRSACEDLGSATTLTPSLVEVLRAGGYTLWWRHADADVCIDRTDLGTAATTSVLNWWKSCDAVCDTATARQLSDAGRMHATAIGAAFDALAIPIGRVVSSEYCRNVETAELMDFGPTIELAQDITFFVYDEANRCASSYARIATPPSPGTNTALIGHAGFTCEILGGLLWSEAAVFKPDGQGGQAFIAQVTWDQWEALP